MTDRRDWKSRAVAQPESGYFRYNMVRQGPLVPARICHEDGLWWAMIEGRAYEKASDPAAAPKVYPIWHSAEMISERQYWADMAKRGLKDALPANQPIDLTKLPPLF